MVNAQEWLDKEYSLERRKEITSLEIFDKGLEGELIIKDFDNLNYLKCSDNPITSLTIENLPNLDILITSRCDITSIVINDCPKLRVFNVNNNFLTNFNFNSLNPDSLTILDIAHNNFPPQTLEFLTSFVKLERAYIGANNKKRLDKDIFNRFYGSLKPLEKLKSLEYLVIDSTDIDNGLEYLSKSFKKISCKSKREEAHCLKIKKELEEVSQKEGVNEKLQEVLEGEPEWVKNWYRIAPWEQFHRSKDVINSATGKFDKTEAKVYTNAKFYLTNLQNDLKDKLGVDILETDGKLNNTETEGNAKGKMDLTTEKTVHTNLQADSQDPSLKHYQEKLERYKKYKEVLEKWTKKLEEHENSEKEKKELAQFQKSFTAETNNLNTFSKEPEKNWINIHNQFSDQELIKQWKSQHFTYQEVQDWVNSFGFHYFNPYDYDFISWIRDIKKLTAEEVLNHYNSNDLRREYQEQKLDSYIQTPLE